MRGGDQPIDAVRYVLGRVAGSYPGLGEREQCALIALTPDGRYASGALRAGPTAVSSSSLRVSAGCS